MYAHVHVYVYAHAISVCTYTCMLYECVCMHTYTHILCVCTYTHTRTHTHTHHTHHTHRHVNTCIYICIHTGTDQKMRATVSKSQKANILESPFHSGSMSICTRALIFENFCQGRQRQEAKKGGRLQGGKTRFVFSGGGEDPREPLAFVSIVIVCVCWHPINAKNVNRYLHKM